MATYPMMCVFLCLSQNRRSTLWVQGNSMISQGMPRSQTMVAHAYNPNYSGGRDQEDCSSKSAKANSLRDPISKKKKGLAEWLKV
jgi:hypothetical protein